MKIEEILENEIIVSFNYIGEYAIDGLKNISSVELPGSLTELGDHAF